jgi:hypothetical protein
VVWRRGRNDAHNVLTRPVEANRRLRRGTSPHGSIWKRRAVAGEKLSGETTGSKKSGTAARNQPVGLTEVGLNPVGAGREKSEGGRHLCPPCLSLCKRRACSQTKKETHCCGMSPSRAQKKEKVRTVMKSLNEKTVSKRRKSASVLRRKRAPRPKKVRGRPSSFYYVD